MVSMQGQFSARRSMILPPRVPFWSWQQAKSVVGPGASVAQARASVSTMKRGQGNTRRGYSRLPCMDPVSLAKFRS